MAYVLAVTLRAREGQQERVRELLGTIVKLTREEEGCVSFLLHRDIADSRSFFVYEHFVDRAAHEAHTRTDHFKNIIEPDLMPLVEFEMRELELL